MLLGHHDRFTFDHAVTVIVVVDRAAASHKGGTDAQDYQYPRSFHRRLLCTRPCAPKSTYAWRNIRDTLLSRTVTNTMPNGSARCALRRIVNRSRQFVTSR